MRVLVFAPHPDDEILGCGGTIAKRAAAGDEVYVCIVTKGGKPLFDSAFIEQGRREARAAHTALGVKETVFLDFPAVMLETVPRYELNGKIAELVRKISPDEVYVPHHGDMQLDHQMVADACMVALRPRSKDVPARVYAYETLSETGWNIPSVQNEFIPNVYEDISGFLAAKLDAMQIFESQLAPFPAARSLGALEALAKFRGATVARGAAEAFMLIREIK